MEETREVAPRDNRRSLLSSMLPFARVGLEQNGRATSPLDNNMLAIIPLMLHVCSGHVVPSSHAGCSSRTEQGQTLTVVSSVSHVLADCHAFERRPGAGENDRDVKAAIHDLYLTDEHLVERF